MKKGKFGFQLLLKIWVPFFTISVVKILVVVDQGLNELVEQGFKLGFFDSFIFNNSEFISKQEFFDTFIRMLVILLQISESFLEIFTLYVDSQHSFIIIFTYKLFDILCAVQSFPTPFVLYQARMKQVVSNAKEILLKSSWNEFCHLVCNS